MGKESSAFFFTFASCGNSVGEEEDLSSSPIRGIIKEAFLGYPD